MRDPWQPHPARGLTLAVAVAVAGLLIAAAMVGGGGPAETDATAVPSRPESRGSVSPVADSAGPSATGERESGPEPVEQAQVDTATSEARGVASTAVSAWQIPDTAARTAALTPLSTPQFLQASATIDPTLVPTSPVASSSTVADSDGLARVRVTLVDGTVLLVDLQLATGWLVDSILPGA